MAAEGKHPSAWEVMHPGEPLPIAEQFRAMREQAYAYFDGKLREDPSYQDVYEQGSACCMETETSDDISALSD
jgi:hypothetical protein